MSHPLSNLHDRLEQWRRRHVGADVLTARQRGHAGVPLLSGCLAQIECATQERFASRVREIV